MLGSQLPPLAAVRAFEAAARLGSFTRAAAELGMTQSAVSYQIRLLEERLGLPLFIRRPRQVVLTDTGRHLASGVTEAFDTLHAAFADIRDQAEGVLTISSTHVFASNWLAPRLGGFQLAHPALAVRLKVGNRLTDFAREEVDAAIRSGDGSWPGLAAHRLLAVRFAPVCSPGLLQRVGGLEEPADLLRRPLLRLISIDDPWWRAWFALAGVDASRLGERGGIQLELQQMEGSAAMAGLGIAMVTPDLWRQELRSGRLVQPFDLVGDLGSSYWLVYPRARQHLAKLRAFRDWLLDQAGAFTAEAG